MTARHRHEIDDADRLAALQASGLLVSLDDEGFDRITRLASRVFGVPISLLSLVEVNRQFFKSAIGLTGALSGARQTPLLNSFCKHVVLDNTALSVPDCANHALVRDGRVIPLEPIAAYLGVPLVWRAQPVGALCVIDERPRAWTDEDVATLRDLAILVTNDLESRHKLQEQARMEAALRKEERRFRLIAETASELIIMKAGFTTRDYVSPAVKTLLGYEPEEFVAIPHDILNHPDDLAKTRQPYERGEAGRARMRFQHRLRHKDGRWIWFDTMMTELEGGEEGRKSLIAICRDVTAQKAAEDLLEEAKRSAEAASLAKSAFIARMSHELRTPLNSILGFSELLSRSDLSATDHERVAQISLGGATLLAHVNQVLDFAAMEAGRLPLSPGSVAPGPLARDVADLLGPQAAGKGIGIDLSVEPAAPGEVRTDGFKVRQILTNLVANAVRFTDAGAITITIAPASTPGRAVRWTVADTGVGIGREDQQALFRPFVQVGEDSARRAMGTGLGLAICKQLVQALGGEIGVESRPGEGASFWFELPQLQPEPAVAARGAEAWPHASDLSHARILVADDNASNRRLVSDYLSTESCRIVAVASGAAALSALSSAPFDLVLMDMRMPDLDGLTTVQRIRELEGAGARTPIVVLTANTYAELDRECREAGADGLLTKPVARSTLLDEVRRWCAAPVNA